MTICTHRSGVIATLAFAAFAATTATAQEQATTDPQAIEVRGGAASFEVDTTLPVLSVHGKSSALEGRVHVRRSAEGPLLEQIEASLPVKSLGTGMRLRDEHMRKYVFTTDTGEVPDVRFVAAKAECSKVSANQSTCQVAGNLTIRGTARPFSIALKVKEDGDKFHASGDSVVRLSAYGIEQPSQLGVTTADEVKLRLEFTARPGREAVATSGRQMPPTAGGTR
jgi:polyisoprenoid-binding protein YceI